MKPAEEKQYEEFVSQTQFHYLNDLDALAGPSVGDQLFFVIRGRFDWNKLKQYALAHGGVCLHDYCTAPTSKPGRWANFLPIQSDVIGLAVSPNGTAADHCCGSPNSARRCRHYRRATSMNRFRLNNLVWAKLCKN